MRLSTDMYHGLVFLLNSFHDEKYEKNSVLVFEVFSPFVA